MLGFCGMSFKIAFLEY